MTGLLDAALAYAARGWPVFPCAPGAKVPAIAGGRGVLDATTDPARITAWWHEMPDANVGIATGAPGPDVIDIDVKLGDGYQAFAELAQAQLLDGAHRYVTTPSGGLHAYYAGTGQRNGTIRKRSIDFRGAGGYVLAPPSIVDGKPYDQLSDHAAAQPGVPVDWTAIRAYLDPPPDPAPFTQPARDRATPDGELRPGDDWAQRTSWAAILAPRGWRQVRDLGNGRAMWRRPGKRDGSSATTRENGGLYVFTTSTEFEVEVPYSKFGAYALLNFGGTEKHNFQAARAELRRLGYGMELPAITPPAFQQPAAARQDDDDQAPAVTDPDNWWSEIAGRHTAIDWEQLWNDTPEDEQWLVEPIIGIGRLIAIYSPPKAGKSLLALEIAAAIACGRPVLSHPASESRKVLYVDLENSRRDLRDRLDALGYKPADLGKLVYLSFPSLPALNSAAGGRELLALAIEHDVALVVIDTVSRVISGRENDADTFNELYYYALAPLKGRDIAVLRLDHAGKDLAKGQRGSSSKNGDVDQVWTLSASGPIVTLRCELSRTPIETPALTLRRETGPLRHEVIAQAAAAVDKVQELIGKLDELDAPRDWGARRIIVRLNEASVPVDKNVLAKAIAARKLRFARTDPSLSDEAESGGAADVPEDHQVHDAEIDVIPGQAYLQDHQVHAGTPLLGDKAQRTCDGSHSSEGLRQVRAGAASVCTSCGERGSHSPDCTSTQGKAPAS